MSRQRVNERRSATAAAKKTEVLGIERRVVPPGTPVRVSVQRSSQYTCPICAQPIVEETDSIQGQEAILCEGTCNSWYHRWCAGVTTLRYEALSHSEDPFHCPTCVFELQQQSISELQSSVRALTVELHNLRAVLAALQEPKEENNPTTKALQEEVHDLRAMIATLQKKLLQQQPTRPH